MWTERYQNGLERISTFCIEICSFDILGTLGANFGFSEFCSLKLLTRHVLGCQGADVLGAFGAWAPAVLVPRALFNRDASATQATDVFGVPKEGAQSMALTLRNRHPHPIIYLPYFS